MNADTDRGVPHRRLVTVSIMLATVMQVLDTTIANVALPSMQGDLGAAQDTISWVLTSYIVASAIMTPATGWLAARMGRRRLFLVSVAGFTASSMLCGLAGGLGQMVLFRLMQGVFGAALAPLSQAVLLDINPRERHGQAMAMWGAGIMVGPILGPTLGGWLTDTFDWRWVFYINLPVGLLAFLGIAAFLPRGDTERRPFDLFGFAALTLFVGALQMMLDRGEQLDWFASGEVLLEAAVAAGAFWVFAIHAATARNPFVDPRIFADRNFLAGTVFTFVIGLVLFATMALLPPVLQRLLGYPTVTAGLILAPRGIGTMVAMLAVGRLIRRVDPRLIILAGLLLAAWSLHGMTAFSTEMGIGPVVLTGVVQGFGLGLVFVPMSTIAFATLPAHFRTEGTALFSLVRNIGSSIGISMVATLLARNTAVGHAELTEHFTPYSDGLATAAAALALPPDSPVLLAQVDRLVTLQATMIAYLDDFTLMMWVTLAAVPLLLFMRRPAPPPAR